MPTGGLIDYSIYIKEGQSHTLPRLRWSTPRQSKKTDFLPSLLTILSAELKICMSLLKHLRAHRESHCNNVSTGQIVVLARLTYVYHEKVTLSKCCRLQPRQQVNVEQRWFWDSFLEKEPNKPKTPLVHPLELPFLCCFGQNHPSVSNMASFLLQTWFSFVVRFCITFLIPPPSF